MKVLIVYAHPEPKSFNGALLREAVRVLESEGHEVIVSDLYAMNWNPCSDRANFTTVSDSDFLKLQDEEIYAGRHGGFAPDIQAEMDKLLACDALIFQFPMWWFSMPAILKGWVDRVLAAGVTYGGGRFYDKGVFRGKRAMLSLTTGGSEVSFAEDGLFGDIGSLLSPINHGVFRFVGFDVLPAFVAWQSARVGDEGRAAYLQSYGTRLRALWSDEPIAYPSLSDFDENFVRRKPA